MLTSAACLQTPRQPRMNGEGGHGVYEGAPQPSHFRGNRKWRICGNHRGKGMLHANHGRNQSCYMGGLWCKDPEICPSTPCVSRDVCAGKRLRREQQKGQKAMAKLAKTSLVKSSPSSIYARSYHTEEHIIHDLTQQEYSSSDKLAICDATFFLNDILHT